MLGPAPGGGGARPAPPEVNTASAADASHNVRVYVRNLSPTTEWQTLLRVLSSAGDVLQGGLLTDGAGRSRGMAVAHFADVEGAQQAVQLLNNAELEGQRLAVALDSRVPQAGGAAGPTSPSAASAASPQPQSAARRGFQPGRRVYVGRLPTDVNWRDLSELLGPFGDLVHVQVPFDRSGRTRGFGVVEFGSAEGAAAAIRKLEHPEVRGQKVILRDDAAVVGAKPSNKLYVGNLSPSVSWQALSYLPLTTYHSPLTTLPLTTYRLPLYRLPLTTYHFTAYHLPLTTLPLATYHLPYRLPLTTFTTYHLLPTTHYYYRRSRTICSLPTAWPTPRSPRAAGSPWDSRWLSSAARPPPRTRCVCCTMSTWTGAPSFCDRSALLHQLPLCFQPALTVYLLRSTLPPCCPPSLHFLPAALRAYISC